MFLTGLCFTLFGIAVTALAFVAATRPQAAPPKVQIEESAIKAAPARFFAERVTPAIPVPPPLQIPVEVLLQQLEKHVRLEQAAAESFIAFPTHAQLHSKTTSPFVN